MILSVIVPCYNAEPFLQECLESIERQTMDDFEAILVDDGSTDGSRRLLEQYTEKDRRFVLLSQKNKGVSAARNLALKNARGEWVTFVDADDILPPNAFAILLQFTEKNVNMIVGSHALFETSIRISKKVIPEGGWDKATEEKRQRIAVQRLIEGDCVLNIMCGKLHRRSFLCDERIVLNESLEIAEDALFNLEAVLTGGSPVYTDELVYYYRQHGQSVTQQHKSVNEYEKHEAWLLAMKSLLKKRGQFEKYYKDYVNSVILRFYKDGGIPCVIHNWKRKISPILNDKDLKRELLDNNSLLQYRLIVSGIYPMVYPMICLAQIIKRKISKA